MSEFHRPTVTKGFNSLRRPRWPSVSLGPKGQRFGEWFLLDTRKRATIERIGALDNDIAGIAYAIAELLQLRARPPRPQGIAGYLKRLRLACNRQRDKWTRSKVEAKLEQREEIERRLEIERLFGQLDWRLERRRTLRKNLSRRERYADPKQARFKEKARDRAKAYFRDRKACKIDGRINFQVS